MAESKVFEVALNLWSVTQQNWNLNSNLISRWSQHDRISDCYRCRPAIVPSVAHTAYFSFLFRLIWFIIVSMECWASSKYSAHNCSLLGMVCLLLNFGHSVFSVFFFFAATKRANSRIFSFLSTIRRTWSFARCSTHKHNGPEFPTDHLGNCQFHNLIFRKTTAIKHHEEAKKEGQKTGFRFVWLRIYIFSHYWFVFCVPFLIIFFGFSASKQEDQRNTKPCQLHEESQRIRQIVMRPEQVDLSWQYLVLAKMLSSAVNCFWLIDSSTCLGTSALCSGTLRLGNSRRWKFLKMLTNLKSIQYLLFRHTKYANTGRSTSICSDCEATILTERREKKHVHKNLLTSSSSSTRCSKTGIDRNAVCQMWRAKYEMILKSVIKWRWDQLKIASRPLPLLFYMYSALETRLYVQFNAIEWNEAHDLVQKTERFIWIETWSRVCCFCLSALICRGPPRCQLRIKFFFRLPHFKALVSCLLLPPHHFFGWT